MDSAASPLCRMFPNLTSLYSRTWSTIGATCNLGAPRPRHHAHAAAACASASAGGGGTANAGGAACGGGRGVAMATDWAEASVERREGGRGARMRERRRLTDVV